MGWKVPYLHIDPADVGRKFERLIRINSQSGKGGIAWVLEQDFGIEIPKAMQPELSKYVQGYSEKVGREISADEVYSVFQNEFVAPAGPYELVGYWPRPDDNDPTFIHGEVKVKVKGEEQMIKADGNGPISAFVNAMQRVVDVDFKIQDYDEEAIGEGADAKAMAYVPLEVKNVGVIYGVGSDSNINQAAVKAIIAGLNRIAKK